MSLLPRRAAAPVSIDLSEVEITAIRAQGAGGQNVNKVSSAVHLRFDIVASVSLADDHKARLLALNDRRITADGVLIIKAQQHRSQDMNRNEALRRLHDIVQGAAVAPDIRRATRPTYASRQRRLETKRQKSLTKALRSGTAHD